MGRGKRRVHRRPAHRDPPASGSKRAQIAISRPPLCLRRKTNRRRGHVEGVPLVDAARRCRQGRRPGPTVARRGVDRRGQRPPLHRSQLCKTVDLAPSCAAHARARKNLQARDGQLPKMGPRGLVGVGRGRPHAVPANESHPPYESARRNPDRDPRMRRLREIHDAPRSRGVALEENRRGADLLRQRRRSQFAVAVALQARRFVRQPDVPLSELPAEARLRPGSRPEDATPPSAVVRRGVSRGVCARFVPREAGQAANGLPGAQPRYGRGVRSLSAESSHGLQ